MKVRTNDVPGREPAAPAAASRREYWERVYSRLQNREPSWHEERPTVSLDLIERARSANAAPSEGASAAGLRILDVGGGASTLVDHLVARRDRVTVCDLSRTALDRAQARMGDSANAVEWMHADVTAMPVARRWDVWHDRAVFHFLVDADDRAAYLRTMRRALNRGGWIVVGTFAEDGPQACSGLPVVRYGQEGLVHALGPGLELAETVSHRHVTPTEAVQPFLYVRLRYTPSGRA